MKLLQVQFDRGEGQGTFVENLDLVLREDDEVEDGFLPLCLIGRNGSGKSHFLQALAESVQAVWHACSPDEERISHDDGMDFRIRYLLFNDVGERGPAEVEIGRSGKGAERRVCVQMRAVGAQDWTNLDLKNAATRTWLPSRVVAYTSGDNETLSVPFFASSLEYGEKVSKSALGSEIEQQTIVPEPRLLLVDYVTHLELLVANLLLGSEDQRTWLLSEVGLSDLRSLRCVVQRKGVELTSELEVLLERLKSCSTTWQYAADSQTYTFDFWVNDETRIGFRTWSATAFDCYRAFHKLSLLNSLGVPQSARERFKRAVNRSRFAARLPEPPDETKVFRFEQVTFCPGADRHGTGAVDYVALSDGEHQLVQVLGTFAMIDEPNVLFLLDEPESHFNPKWRVEFLSNILDTPTSSGRRRAGGRAGQQEALITTHAPFVPSDMPRERVLIFERLQDGELSVRRPDAQTFGASYEEILESCFKIYPPISQLSRDAIAEGMASDDPEKVTETLSELGSSVDRALLSDHLRELQHGSDDVLHSPD